jgi:hypothetical protein
MTRLPLVLAAFLTVPTVAPAAPPAPDTLLPASTVVYFAAPDAAAAFDAWEGTRFNQLIREPALKPYRDELDRLGSGLLIVDRLGLNRDVLKAASGGFGSYALVPTPKGTASVVILDTTGNADGRAALLKRAAEVVKGHGGQVGSQKVGGADATTYSVPGVEGGRAFAAVGVVRDEVVIFSEDVAVLDGMLARWSGGAGAFAGHEPYRNVLARTAFPDGKPAHLTWYFDPFAFADAERLEKRERARASDPVEVLRTGGLFALIETERLARAEPAKRDVLELLKAEGFAGVKAVGGRVRLGDGPFDLLHRAAVYAPGPFEGAARMLDFPADKFPGAPDWVPADVSRFITLRWNLPRALDSFGSIFDRISGEKGDFDAVLDALAKDKDGPMVDVRRDVVGRLTGKVSSIADTPDPVPDRGERSLIAYEAREEKELAAAIGALLAGDAKSREFQGVTIWTITPKPKRPKSGGPPIQVPPTVIAVAHGTLFVADDAGFLEKVLAKGAGPRLSADPQFARVVADLEKLGGGRAAAWSYVRPAEVARGAYELARTGQPTASRGFTAQLFQGLLAGGPGRRTDPSKLPPFEKIGPYLHPAGAFSTPVKDGWDVVGFVYKSAKP